MPMLVMLVLSFFLTTTLYAKLEIKQDTTEGFSIELKTKTFKKSLVHRKEGSYWELSLEGLTKTSLAGAPEIPYQNLTLQVPKDKEIQFTIQNVTSKKAEPLSYPVAYAAFLPIHVEKPIPAKIDASAYEKAYGENVVEWIETGRVGEQQVVKFRVWPLHYHPLKKEITHRPSITIKFTYKSSSKKWSSPTKIQASTILPLAVDNPGAAVSKLANESQRELIISHSSYQIDLFHLLEFKKKKGKNFSVHYVNGKTAEEIKQIIRQEYSTSDAPISTLLIGNPAQIPGFKGKNDNTWTDFPYQTLTNSSMPEISLGRIPVSNSSELKAFTEKIISRENGEINSNEVLVTSGKDASLGCPNNVSKVGDKFKTQAAAINVTKRLMTNVSSNDVIQAYNQNPNIIVYDGHGNRQGMQEIPLIISNLSQLQNHFFPIILDIACLNANWNATANWKNFAASILTIAEHGAAGILASGGSGYGHDFFQSIAEIMGKANAHLTTDPQGNTIGKIILAAKIRHAEEDRTFWNYYGDPATSVWRP